MLIRIEIVGEDGQIKTFLDIEKKTADTVRESKKTKKKKHEKHAENIAEKQGKHVSHDPFQMGCKKQCWLTFLTTSNLGRSDSAIHTEGQMQELD
ncbi:unnamed protein product [Timema podura]|uniref:Uncharacterized protein n=1 Tax=Timema podura TaxID=61482 RepID=A0ABN7PAV8_TIMPD|nr:unnamed protein product [Timema podura]